MGRFLRWSDGSWISLRSHYSHTNIWSLQISTEANLIRRTRSHLDASFLTEITPWMSIRFDLLILFSRELNRSTGGWWNQIISIFFFTFLFLRENQRSTKENKRSNLFLLLFLSNPWTRSTKGEDNLFVYLMDQEGEKKLD